MYRPGALSAYNPDKVPQSDFAAAMRAGSDVLLNHYTKMYNAENLWRITRIPVETPGADWRWLPDDLIPFCLPNTADTHSDWQGLFGRLDWEGYFKTVLCSPSLFRHVVIHPRQVRNSLSSLHKELSY
jgi:DNA (cytosine-5)-methyltransferase 1